MIPNAVLAAFSLAVTLVMGAAGSTARAQDAPAGNAETGKRVYLAVGCQYCHGRAGQGGALNYAAPPLARTELPLEAFKMVLRDSLRDMPAYSDAVLADKDIADIYAFTQSLPGRRPAKDIAILND
jgi:mono/diheme cytochrome c family protein